jgi:uncharacterized membrane protein YeaQ/YmgE (transglycosylase-associated protein family)
MMLFVHSAGGVIGALAGAILWVKTAHTSEGGAMYLLFGSLVGTVVGHFVDDYNKKHP